MICNGIQRSIITVYYIASYFISQYVLSNFLYWTQHAVIQPCFYQRLFEEASVVHSGSIFLQETTSWVFQVCHTFTIQKYPSIKQQRTKEFLIKENYKNTKYVAFYSYNYIKYIFMLPFCDWCCSTFSMCSHPTADLSWRSFWTPNFPPKPDV